MKHFIVGGKLCLSEFNLDNEPVKIESGCLMPNIPDGPVYVHDWQGMGEFVKISYSLDSSLYATVTDETLPSYIEKIEIKKPRGLGWVYRYGKWKKPWE